MPHLDIFELYIPQLHRQRTIRVWLPPNYHRNQQQRYPVLYMHDGQNLFDPRTAAYGEAWDAHEAVKRLMQAFEFPGAIIVGIDNARSVKRMDEYSPWVNERVDELGSMQPMGGEGEAYGRFLVETLKPLIDKKYRTLVDRNNTAVAGSSMGGYISIYLGAKYPHVFSMVGAFSSAIWFMEAPLHTCLDAMDLNYPVRWYLDVGTKETSNPIVSDFDKLYVDGTLKIQTHLLTIGVPEESIHVVIEEDAVHNEKAWARRLPSALEWLFYLS